MEIYRSFFIFLLFSVLYLNVASRMTGMSKSFSQKVLMINYSKLLAYLFQLFQKHVDTSTKSTSCFCYNSEKECAKSKNESQKKYEFPSSRSTRKCRKDLQQMEDFKKNFVASLYLKVCTFQCFTKYFQYLMAYWFSDGYN